MLLSQTNTLHTVTQSAKVNNDDTSMEDIDQYIARISGQNKHETVFNDTFNKSPSVTMKYEEVKKKITGQDSDSTLDFLNYIDNFQKENVKC